MIKRISVVIFLILLFSFPVFAESEDFYEKTAEISGADTLPDLLPDKTEDYLRHNGISPDSYNWAIEMTPENVFSHILNFLKSGAKAPIASGSTVLAVILISAAVSANTNDGSALGATSYVSVAAAAAAIAIPVFSVVTAAANAMKGCAVFMTGFIPVFAVVVAASGAKVTALSAETLLLCAADGVSFVSSFAVMPLMSGYITVSIASSVSPLLSKSGIAEGIKKLAFWIMSLITTVFIGILSIQSSVAASADTLTVKTAKFVLGSTVPIAGTALAEALTTVTASMGTIKAAIGVYGVIACLLIFLPLLAELFVWRIMLMLCSACADLFSVNRLSALLRSVDGAMSVLIGIILLSAALFVISLSIIVSVGK